MALSNATETALLSYMFNATAPSWAAATHLDIHLHTADPGDAGTSATSEATYTGYAVITVARNAGSFAVTGDTVSNTSLLQFDACTGGANTITHSSITPSGSTTILFKGALTSPLNVSTGITPQIPANQITVQMD